MPALVFTDATTWIHGFDYTTQSNNITLNAEGEDLDATTFGGNGFRQRVMGLREVSSEHAGFWSGPVDEAMWEGFGKTNRVVTVSPTGVEGGPAYFYQAGQFSYEIGGSVGELIPFSISMMSSNTLGVVRGKLAKAKGTVSATGALGSVVELTAPTSGQYVYASLHVFDAGTTLTVQVQSDTNSTFATPTVRATFPAVTTEGGFWLARVAGPFVGETHWRMSVSAITGTFEVAGAIAVQ
jgi:hypothetical protein